MRLNDILLGNDYLISCHVVRVGFIMNEKKTIQATAFQMILEKQYQFYKET